MGAMDAADDAAAHAYAHAHKPARTHESFGKVSKVKPKPST